MQNLLILDVSIWTLVKALFILGLLIYIIFALVVVRQVNLMNETLELGHEKAVKALSYLHLLFALGVFFLALFIL